FQQYVGGDGYRHLAYAGVIPSWVTKLARGVIGYAERLSAFWSYRPIRFLRFLRSEKVTSVLRSGMPAQNGLPSGPENSRCRSGCRSRLAAMLSLVSTRMTRPPSFCRDPSRRFGQGSLLRFSNARSCRAWAFVPQRFTSQ